MDAVPDLLRHQLVDGPHAGEPTVERGDLERLARECQAADCQLGLDSTVIETRFNVVRSSLPAVIETLRVLRDYLAPEDWAAVSLRADGLARADAVSVAGGRRGGRWRSCFGRCVVRISTR